MMIMMMMMMMMMMMVLMRTRAMKMKIVVLRVKGMKIIRHSRLSGLTCMYTGDGCWRGRDYYLM